MPILFVNCIETCLLHKFITKCCMMLLDLHTKAEVDVDAVIKYNMDLFNIIVIL